MNESTDKNVWRSFVASYDWNLLWNVLARSRDGIGGTRIIPLLTNALRTFKPRRILSDKIVKKRTRKRCDAGRLSVSSCRVVGSMLREAYAWFPNASVKRTRKELWVIRLYKQLQILVSRAADKQLTVYTVSTLKLKNAQAVFIYQAWQVSILSRQERRVEIYRWIKIDIS